MCRPIKDQDFFLRKTKTPDYNTLSSIVRLPSPSQNLTDFPPSQRNSISTSSSLPPSDSPLSQLVYTITIHPIPRYSNRSPFPTRGQTLKVLGSTTLYEMTENFQAGGTEFQKSYRRRGVRMRMSGRGGGRVRGGGGPGRERWGACGGVKGCCILMEERGRSIMLSE